MDVNTKKADAKGVGGQVEAMDGMVEEDSYCVEVLVQIAATLAPLDRSAASFSNSR